MFSCETYEIFKNIIFEVCERLSETCSFTWSAFFNNLQFCLPILPSLLLILLQSEAVVRWCSAKNFVFQRISQISQENTCSKDAFLMKMQIYRV